MKHGIMPSEPVSKTSRTTCSARRGGAPKRAFSRFDRVFATIAFHEFFISSLFLPDTCSSRVYQTYIIQT